VMTFFRMIYFTLRNRRRERYRVNLACRGSQEQSFLPRRGPTSRRSRHHEAVCQRAAVGREIERQCGSESFGPSRVLG